LVHKQISKALDFSVALDLGIAIFWFRLETLSSYVTNKPYMPFSNLRWSPAVQYNNRKQNVYNDLCMNSSADMDFFARFV
jgi:hypothetical protein